MNNNFFFNPLFYLVIHNLWGSSDDFVLILGSLRPYPQTPRRSVPTSIERPDYANHKEGISLSEQSFRGTAVIKQLDDDEIDAMRVACKVS